MARINEDTLWKVNRTAGDDDSPTDFLAKDSVLLPAWAKFKASGQSNRFFRSQDDLSIDGFGPATTSSIIARQMTDAAIIRILDVCGYVRFQPQSPPGAAAAAAAEKASDHAAEFYQRVPLGWTLGRLMTT